MEHEITVTTEKCYGAYSVVWVYFVFSLCEGAAMHPSFTQASEITHDCLALLLKYN
jgi:hypothetical protein